MWQNFWPTRPESRGGLSMMGVELVSRAALIRIVVETKKRIASEGAGRLLVFRFRRGTVIPMVYVPGPEYVWIAVYELTDEV